MAVDYRLIRLEEQESAFNFLVDTFGLNREQFRREHSLSDPGLWDRTRVAIGADGGLLAVVAFLRRRIRDANGAPRPVGGVYTVATRPDARRQGHGRRLMELTIEAMRQDGRDWSLLSSSEEGRRLYESLGWRAYSTPYRQGTLGDDRPEVTGTYAVRFYDPLREPGGWAPLAAVYDAANAARPLTLVRDAAYWQGYAGVRFADVLSNKGGAFLVASRANDTAIRGYVFAWFHDAEYARRHVGAPDGSFLVTEFGALPGDEEAIPALLSAVADHAAAHGMPRGRIQAPRDPRIDACLERLFGDTLNEDASTDLMARSIAPAFDRPHIDAMFAAPGAIFWPIDGF